MSARKRISFFICCCFLGLVQSDTEADGYSGEVKELFDDLTNYKSNVDKAKQKIEQFPDESLDRKYAIGLVNLYTQESKFFSTLNSEMRNNFPNNKTDIWRRAGDLMNRGIDIIGPTVHELLYRGCSKLMTTPVAGQEFIFNQITSTTQSKQTAEFFVTCAKGILFRLTDVNGLSVANYSAFTFEREVLVQSYNIFKVKQGPIQTDNYIIFELDGQSELNRKEKGWEVRSNLGHREHVGIHIHSFAVIILTLCNIFRF